MKWYFVSQNSYKYKELAPLCAAYHIELIHFDHGIRERQLTNFDEIVADKAIEACSVLRSNVLVDHSGLEMMCFNRLPGGLTQLWWDRLTHGLEDIAGRLGNRQAAAITSLGYCNGRRVWTARASVDGTLVSPAGPTQFQWDAIFKPDNSLKRYAEMTVQEKNSISQRGQAFGDLIGQLKLAQELK